MCFLNSASTLVRQRVRQLAKYSHAILPFPLCCILCGLYFLLTLKRVLLSAPFPKEAAVMKLYSQYWYNFAEVKEKVSKGPATTLCSIKLHPALLLNFSFKIYSCLICNLWNASAWAQQLFINILNQRIKLSANLQ